MKKSLLLLSAVMICFSVSAQKVIENPKHGFATISTLKITRIELNKTATVLHFDISYRPKNWINIPSKTFIQPVNSDKKLYIEKAEGIGIDEKFYMPESGKTSYALYFPPVNESVEAIDYGEEGASWFIYDIELIPKKWTSVLPKVLVGSWINTDGSNSWDYGFYENLAIYQSDFWQYEKAETQSKIFRIVLRKDQESKIIFAKPGKKGKVWFGEDPKKMKLYSQDYTDNPKYVTENDEDFRMPVFMRDSAIYKGYIYGYTSRAGVKTGLIHVDDILSNKQESYLVRINDDGTFEVKYPLYYPHEIWVRSSLYNSSVYVEPGKTTFQLINAGNKYNGSLFMGECAKVNADLLASNNIYSYNYQKIRDSILNMTPQQYKDYVLKAMDVDMKKYNEYKNSHSLCKKASRIRETGLLYRYYGNLFEYNMMKQQVFLLKNKTEGQREAKPYQREVLDPGYYDFVKDIAFNDPLAVVTNDYRTLINRVEFADIVRQRFNEVSYLNIIEQFEKSGIEVSPQVREAYRVSWEMRNAVDMDKAKAEYKEKYGSVMDEFNAINREVINEISNALFQDLRQKSLKETFDIKDGLALDIMKAQDKCNRLESTFTPYTKQQLASMKNEFTIPFIADHITIKNEEIIARIEANKSKTDYRLYDTPKTEADKIFDAIMEKFRGKVVYVDFWATWCGPCLSGMRTIAPLKEELADMDIVFVYITNPSSPETTYKNMIPDIKGEHFRLSQDEWNYISGRFKISGIPHYALVNKRGEVVNPHLSHMDNLSLKELLMKYINE